VSPIQLAAAPPAPPTVPVVVAAAPPFAKAPFVVLAGAEFAALLSQVSLPAPFGPPPEPTLMKTVAPGVTLMEFVLA
jgi:hypothetical protein